jgi:hypothetical protein
MIDINFKICSANNLVPDFCTMGTEYFLRYSGRSVVLNTNLLLVPVCEWVGAVPPALLRASTGMSRGDFYLYKGCFKNSFTTLKAYRNLYRGHT